MPNLASSSRAQLRYIKESQFGITPTTGNAVNLRMTGESLDFAITKEDSKEIRSDRQTTSMNPVSAQATGGYQFELSYKEYDPFLESVFQSAFTVFGVNGVGAAFDATISATEITADAPTSGASIFTNLQLGQWFRLITSDPADTNYGKLFRVSTTVAPTATIITLDTTTPGSVEVVTGAQVQTSRLTNGVVQSSFTLERALEDVGQYFAYRGMTPSKVDLSLASESLITGSFDFLGKDVIRDTSTALPGTPVESQTYEITNAATGIGKLYEFGAPVTDTFIKSLSVSVDNSLRAQTALGTLGLIGVGSGTIKVTGSIEVYFSNGNMYDRFVDNINTGVIAAVQDAEGNGYVLSMPKVNLSSGKIMAGSRDTDIMATFDFMALADVENAVPALRKTLFLDRVGVAV